MAAPSQILPISASGARGASSAVPPRSAGTKLKTAPPAPRPLAARMSKLAELSVPLAVLGIVLAMIMPLPSFLLDMLISANLTVSIIVLMVSLYITKPVEFNVFPTTLLLLTLFRLALNISSSRLILIQGNAGTRAAGQVIEAFGNFVVGGNYIIGVVIFLVLIAIQYVVINHGAVRISEVTARFTLDALPGKQMSIDADLNAGLIDEADARARRKNLAAEAEFYGAMDGASRFTQRDAVASILITVINIVAGFLIGVFQHGMDLQRALATYTVLTIGDGLVTVIPALMVSVSGGLIVTRATSDNQLGSEMRRQIFSNPQPLMLAGGVLIALAAFPGLPTLPFLLLGSGVGYAGWISRQTALRAVSAVPAGVPALAEKLETVLKVEPLAIEVGLGLIKLVEGGPASPLLRRIGAIRKQIAAEAGYLVPPVRVTDNLQLKTGEYVVLLKSAEIARFEILQSCELAIHAGAAANGSGVEMRGAGMDAMGAANSSLTSAEPAVPLGGIATREPAFGIPAVWVPAEKAESARALGYTVVDAVSIIGTHLTELIRRHAFELLSRQEVKNILDRVAEENPRVVEDLVPKLLPLATVQRVLQNLLRERVSIRDAVTILEALGDAGAMTKNPVLLTEYVRQAIRRLLVRPFLSQENELPALFVDPQIEQAIEASIEHNEHASHSNLPPQRVRDMVDKAARAAGSAETPLAAITTSAARFFLRQMVEAKLPNLSILSHNEIPAGVHVISLGLLQ
jgi:flagellar biosynthesis protein FlhA